MITGRRTWPMLAVALALALGPAAASAEGLADVGGAEWRVEQPEPPPPPPPGVQGSKIPIGLGRIGDIEFFSPNRGALITAGNGSTISPGVWLYNGERWRELSVACGATDGRIAWAGPDEFWTISDGRPGQALVNGERPPLQDNTLCHFAPPPGDSTGQIEIVASYASPAFQTTSYRAMHAAACLSPSDCWFAGDALQNPEIGAFQLHWNGSSLEPAPYLPEGHAVMDMSEFEGHLYSSVRLLEDDRVLTVLRHPPPLHLLEEEEGATGSWEGVSELPIYQEGEFFAALDFLHLSSAGDSMWAAAGPALTNPEGSLEAGVTVIRRLEGAPGWTQLLGPETAPSGRERFPEEVVDAIAAEPGGEGAWIALDTKVDAGSEEPDPDAHAQIARIAADGTISDELTLPSQEQPLGPKGAADKLTCPAQHDCWLTTTDGWLLHLAVAGERQLSRDGDPVFSNEEPIVFRPLDLGVPQLPPDAPPVDDSGLQETPPETTEPARPVAINTFATVTVPLLSGLRTRLVHNTTLEVKFHLSVKARVRIVAKRHRSTVASTPNRIFTAGSRSLSLHLNVHRWPTKLDLQTHALAPLKTTSTREAGPGSDSVSTSLAFPHTSKLLESGLLP
jgi:hypothetical protein